MIVLGQAIGGADDVETVAWSRVFVQRGVVALGDRILRTLGMKSVFNGAFRRLIKLRKRPIGESSEGCEDAANAFGVHDERTHMIFRRRIDLEVSDIVADPLLLRLIPPDLRTRLVPRLARNIARGPIVEYAAVHRPRPSPVRMHSEAGWV